MNDDTSPLQALQATLDLGNSRFHLIATTHVTVPGADLASRHFIHLEGVWTPSSRTLAARLTSDRLEYEFLASRTVAHFRERDAAPDGAWQKTQRDDEVAESIPFHDPCLLFDNVGLSAAEFRRIERRGWGGEELTMWRTDWSPEQYGSTFRTSCWIDGSGLIRRIREESSIKEPRILGTATLDLYDFGLEWSLVLPRGDRGAFVLP